MLMERCLKSPQGNFLGTFKIVKSGGRDLADTADYKTDILMARRRLLGQRGVAPPGAICVFLRLSRNRLKSTHIL
jgi:hypothetical protein